MSVMYRFGTKQLELTTEEWGEEGEQVEHKVKYIVSQKLIPNCIIYVLK